MVQDCTYSKGRDIISVVPGLGVDIRGAIEQGIIKDTSAAVFHNKIEKLDEVGIVARDMFDIVEYERSYTKFRRFVKDNESKKE